MHALVDKYVPKLTSALNQPIGQTTMALDAIEKDARRRETNPRYLVTDTVRAYTKADVAIQNGGGVRTNRS